MKKVVISQSMYFPWVGLLEQIALADVFVHYDDVQFTRGFYNRVQIKTPHGTPWITVPTKDYHRGQNIDSVQIDYTSNWGDSHRESLKQAYSKAPFLSDMLRVYDSVIQDKGPTIADVSRASMLAVVKYLKIGTPCEFLDSKTMNVPGASTKRLLDIVKAVAGDVYVTGHGAKNYLEHEAFEAAGVRVEYMDYQRLPYPQLNGPFIPYVSSLDLIANCGREGRKYIVSKSKYWKEFLNDSSR